MDQIVRTIPNYKVIEKLGECPQSIIYKAFHKKNPDRQLALRVLNAVSVSERQRRHFRQRIEHLKILHDIHLITPLSFDVKEDAAFITQEYFKGINTRRVGQKTNQDYLE